MNNKIFLKEAILGILIFLTLAGKIWVGEEILRVEYKNEVFSLGDEYLVEGSVKKYFI